MKQLIALFGLIALLASPAFACDGPYLRKYATATTVDFNLWKLDGTGLKSDAVSATHDIKIMKDEGAEADTTADAFVDEGQGYSLALTDTETTAARIVIYIVDQSGPQVWLDKCLIIETYGNASAAMAFDLSDAEQDVNVAKISTSSTAADNLETAMIDTGTLQAGNTTTATLALAASATADIYNGKLLTFTGGTGAGQQACIVDYSTGRVATLDRTIATLGADTTYQLSADGGCEQALKNYETGLNLKTGAIANTTFAAGAIDASAIAAGAIGASEVATDAIGAAEVANDAAVEIGAECSSSGISNRKK